MVKRGIAITKKSIDDFIGLIKSKKSIVITGHKETDADSLFSIVFFDRFVRNVNPDAEIYSCIDEIEQVTEDTAELVKKYSIDVGNAKNLKFKTTPDLMILVDNQLETNYSLMPKGIPLTKNGEVAIDVSCWDHHIISDGEYLSDFRDDTVNSTASIIISRFMAEQNGSYIESLKDDHELCTVGYQAVLVDSGLKESIIVKEDRQAHDFFKQSADLIYLYQLNQNKISEATASVLAKAYDPNSRKNIRDIVTYCYVPRMKEGQTKELAIVANEILRISTSRTESIVVGVIDEGEDKENTLRMSIRSEKPDRKFNAKSIAKIYNGGGDRYKGGAQIGLGILKYSIDIPEFEKLISDEIEFRLLGSELNESGDKLKKKTLVEPTPLEVLVQDREIEGDVPALIGNAMHNYSLRGNNQYITLFANLNIDSENSSEKQLNENDIISLFKIEDIYLKRMDDTTKFKSCKASVVYSLINGEVEPYVVGVVSVKNNENNNGRLDPEEIARNIFRNNSTLEIINMQPNGIKRAVVRIPLPFLQYTTQHQYLHKIIYTEVEERLSKALGDKSNVLVEK